MQSNYLRISVAAVLLAACVSARAEDEPKKTIPGFPEGTDVELVFSAGWGFFGFGNSLFANGHDEPTTELSDNWMEGFVKGGFKRHAQAIGWRRALRRDHRRRRTHLQRAATAGRRRSLVIRR